MKTFIITTVIALSFSFTTAMAQSSGIVGQWKTIDDETGDAKSIVEITQDGKEFKGKIVELLNPTEPNPKCKECEGDKKNAPITGLEIIWDLKSSGKNEWSDGQILDPQKGKVYRLNAELKDKGKKLDIRGFIGFSLFGRTQTWHRHEATAEPKAEAPVEPSTDSSEEATE